MVWNPVLCINRFSSKFGFSQCFGHVIKVSAKIINNSRQRRFFRGKILDLTFENDLGENLNQTFGSSLIYNMSARHEQHECDTSNTNATLTTRVRQKRHECDTSARRVLHERHQCNTSEKF